MAIDRSTDPLWQLWRPSWQGRNLEHVIGYYEKRVNGPNGPDPQHIECSCTKCGPQGDWKTVCNTGNVRTHISRYAANHIHVDPLKPQTGLR